jgi:hypothetical protein
MTQTGSAPLRLRACGLLARYKLASDAYIIAVRCNCMGLSRSDAAWRLGKHREFDKYTPPHPITTLWHRLGQLFSKPLT